MRSGLDQARLSAASVTATRTQPPLKTPASSLAVVMACPDPEGPAIGVMLAVVLVGIIRFGTADFRSVEDPTSSSFPST